MGCTKISTLRLLCHCCRQELYKEAQVHRSASPESYRDRRMPGPALDCAAQEAAAWLQGKDTDRTAAVV